MWNECQYADKTPCCAHQDDLPETRQPIHKQSSVMCSPETLEVVSGQHQAVDGETGVGGFTLQ